MKKLMALLLSLVLIASVSVFALAEEESTVVSDAAMAYFADYDGSAVIKTPALFEKIDAGEDMLILDIRRADAYAEGHLAGAVNLPFGPAIAENLALIPDDVPVYVYCYSGQTASQATALLNVAGKYAANIQSGFNNGISQTEGYEAYLSTDEATLAGDTYDVDPDIQAAITAYFDVVAANAGTAYAANNFSADSLYDVLDAELDGYFVYDVRQADAYADGHIQGAVNNPFSAGMQENFAAQLPTDGIIIVHCYTGQTASQTVAILRLLGYDAYNLAGGMNNGWLASEYDVVTD